MTFTACLGIVAIFDIQTRSGTFLFSCHIHLAQNLVMCEDGSILLPLLLVLVRFIMEHAVIEMFVSAKAGWYSRHLKPLQIS